MTSGGDDDEDGGDGDSATAPSSSTCTSDNSDSDDDGGGQGGVPHLSLDGGGGGDDDGSPAQLHPALGIASSPQRFAASGSGRDRRLFATLKETLRRFSWRVKLHTLVIYLTNISMFVAVLNLLRSSKMGGAKINVSAVLGQDGRGHGGSGGGGGGGGGGDDGDAMARRWNLLGVPRGPTHNFTLQRADRPAQQQRLALDAAKLCELAYDAAVHSPMLLPSTQWAGWTNSSLWAVSTLLLWGLALAWSAYLFRLVARDYDDIVSFNEQDPYGLSRMRRRWKISSFWLDYIVLECGLATLLLLACSGYAYALIVRIAVQAETQFAGVGGVSACRAVVDTNFLLDLTVAFVLLNAKAFTVLLTIHDSERKNRLLFFTGNLKVLDYIVTRVDDYAGQASDRTRRLASIALTRATGGKMTNLVETNLNSKMKRLKKAKQQMQEMLGKSPLSSPLSTPLSTPLTTPQRPARVARAVAVEPGAGGKPHAD